MLSRRDVALLLHRGGPRMLLARFAHWWVAIERSADLVQLSGVSTATSEQSAGTVICDQIDELCRSAAGGRDAAGQHQCR